LNSEFDQVRIQILQKQERKNSNEAVAVVLSEESRSKMLDFPTLKKP